MDIDGRIFIAVHRCISSSDHLPTHAPEALLGPEISFRLNTVWKPKSTPPPDLSKLLAYRPTHEDSELSSIASNEEGTSFALFPLTSLMTNLRPCMSPLQEGQALSSTLLAFSQDIPFSDIKQWHARHPTVPPKRLEEEAAKGFGERARKK